MGGKFDVTSRECGASSSGTAYSSGREADAPISLPRVTHARQPGGVDFAKLVHGDVYGVCWS